MHGRIKTAGVFLILLAATCLEAGVGPTIQIDNKADPRIEIVPIDDAHRTGVPRSLGDLGLTFPPGSFVLVNRRGISITAIVVRWTYTDGGGEMKQRRMNCDAYALPPLTRLSKRMISRS